MNTLFAGIIFIVIAIIILLLNYFFDYYDKKYYDKETLAKVNNGLGWRSLSIRMVFTVTILFLAGAFLVIKHIIGF